MPALTVTDQQAELERLQTLVELAARKLSTVNQQILESTRQFELIRVEQQNILDELRRQIREARIEFTEYDTALRTVRESDQQRTIELDAKERNLHGRERMLITERQDFEQEKKRWRQTREL